MEINIIVRNKIAKLVEPVTAVCGNSDYIVNFDFDKEWDKYETKTARFKSNGSYTDVIFEGNQCTMPIINDSYSVKIGCYAGNLHTTTSAYLILKKSILDGSGSPEDPTPDVYHQIMDKLNNLDVEGYKELDSEIGTLTDLETDDKTDLVSAINEASFGTVRYNKKQVFSEEQKAQARENIDALGVFGFSELKKTEIKYKFFPNTTFFNSIEAFASPDFSPLDPETLTEEEATAWAYFCMLVQGGDSFQTIYVYKYEPVYKYFSLMIDKGVCGENFYAVHPYKKSFIITIKGSDAYLQLYNYFDYAKNPDKKTFCIFLRNKSGRSIWQATYNALTEKVEFFSVCGRLEVKCSGSDLTEPDTLPQLEMSADPAKDMEIATKQYVDNSTSADIIDALWLLSNSEILSFIYQDDTFYASPSGELYYF